MKIYLGERDHCAAVENPEEQHDNSGENTVCEVASALDNIADGEASAFGDFNDMTMAGAEVPTNSPNSDKK